MSEEDFRQKSTRLKSPSRYRKGEGLETERIFKNQDSRVCYIGTMPRLIQIET